MVDMQLRQMKEFFGLYNKISECCFNDCVNTLFERGTSLDEVKCLDRCISKYIGLNHKVMDVFVEIQPSIVQKRMDEMSKQQEALLPNEEATNTSV